MTNITTLTARTTLANAGAATTATPLNILAAALWLPPGLWKLTGTIGSVAATGTTVTNVQGGVSLTSATLPTADAGLAELSGTLTTAGTEVIALPPVLVPSGDGGVSVYLVGQAAFGTSTLGLFGSILAERIAD